MFLSTPSLLLLTWFHLSPALDPLGHSHTCLLLPPLYSAVSPSPSSLLQLQRWSQRPRVTQQLLDQTALKEGPSVMSGKALHQRPRLCTVIQSSPSGKLAWKGCFGGTCLCDLQGGAWLASSGLASWRGPAALGVQGEGPQSAPPASTPAPASTSTHCSR